MSQATVSERKPESTTAGLADSFTKSVLLISFLMILQRLVGFVRSFYVCGALTPAHVGQWDLAFNFFVLAAPLSVLGIPGSFGRYLARYEERGQASRLLRQSLTVCVLLTLLFALLTFGLKEPISIIFFGDPSQASLVQLLAIGLPVVAIFNFATSWLTGRRLNRYVFRTQFAQTLFFATLCVVFFRFHSVSATSVVLGYLGSCLMGTVLGLGYMILSDPADHTETNLRAIDPVWKVVLPFALWVWISDLMESLFVLCDRLLIVNFHPVTEAGVQSLIGQYHTACLFPFLLTTFGAMVASTGLPYLSKDWESGNRDAVSRRTNLMIVSLGVLCLAVSVVILLVAPLLFGQLWKDKFAVGESLLPITLCYCSIAALAFVAQNYLWCIERAWMSTIVLVVGLACNFAFGLALVVPYGLDGVVTSTLIAHIVVLVGVLALCHHNGMRIESGVILTVLALFMISFGSLPALACLVCVLVCAWRTEWLFSSEDKEAFHQRFKEISARVLQKAS